MILAALEKAPEEICDDDFEEILDELKIVPRLLHQRDPLRQRVEQGGQRWRRNRRRQVARGHLRGPPVCLAPLRPAQQGGGTGRAATPAPPVAPPPQGGVLRGACRGRPARAPAPRLDAHARAGPARTRARGRARSRPRRLRHRLLEHRGDRRRSPSGAMGDVSRGRPRPPRRVRATSRPRRLRSVPGGPPAPRAAGHVRCGSRPRSVSGATPSPARRRPPDGSRRCQRPASSMSPRAAREGACGSR